MQPSGLLVLGAVASCSALHLPRHRTAYQLKAARVLFPRKRDSPLVVTTTGHQFPATASKPGKVPLSLQLKPYKASLDILILQERRFVEACHADEKSLVHEADLLREQLQAFLEIQRTKLLNFFKLKTCQARVRGIVRRVRMLMRRAQELRNEASEHEVLLHRLERVQRRMTRAEQTGGASMEQRSGRA